MAEQLPDKEPEYPKDDCMFCEEEFVLDKANTYIFKYTDMPDNTQHLGSLCPHCQQLNIAFLSTENTREHYGQFGYGVHEQPVPSIDVMDGYLRVFDIPLIQEKELSPEEDAHVKYLGHLLMNDLVTPEDFGGDGKSTMVL